MISIGSRWDDKNGCRVTVIERSGDLVVYRRPRGLGPSVVPGRLEEFEFLATFAPVDEVEEAKKTSTTELVGLVVSVQSLLAAGTLTSEFLLRSYKTRFDAAAVELNARVPPRVAT